MNTLVIRPGALGDAILTLPLLSALKQNFGDELFVLGTSSSWKFLRPAASVQVLDFGSTDWLGLFADDARISAEATNVLRETKRAFVFLKQDGGAIERRLKEFGVQQVLCVNPPPSSMENFAASLENARVTDWPKQALSVQHAARVLGAAGTEDVSEWISLSSGERANETEFLDALRRKFSCDRFVALHPGSGGAWKCWPARFFSDLAALLYAKAHCIPLIIFGPADERARSEFSANMERGAAWVSIDSRTLREVFAILSGCALAITNDSGIAHLAARTTQTLAIFGKSDPVVWAPVGDDVTTIQAPHGQLETLSVDSVFAVAARKLSIE